MRVKLALVIIPAFLLAGLIFFITVAAPRLLASTRLPPPEPIAFDHFRHVQVAGLECSFCHRTAATSPTAGYPDVQQCMFCHQVIASGEAEKVRAAWQQQKPIDWIRIHRLPDHVAFAHDPHIRAGVSCATCHGDVGMKQGQVAQVRSLTMGDCLSCHQQRGAPTECMVCHR